MRVNLLPYLSLYVAAQDSLVWSLVTKLVGIVGKALNPKPDGEMSIAKVLKSWNRIPTIPATLAVKGF